MKIENLRIDRFGPWRELELPLNARGVSLFSGPNEAGKTTLLRFLRGMMYGFLADEWRAGESRIGGSIDVARDGRSCRVQRHRENATRETLSVHGLTRVGPAEELLDEMLAGTSRAVFENVFAVGLVELQQLAALHAEETAAKLYGVSLGANGKRLLHALHATDAARRELFDGERTTGTLVERLALDEQRKLESRSAAALRDEHDRLMESQSETREQIDELNSRRAGMESQLRGHRFMQRIWEPWNLVREYQHELDALPDVEDFPENGLRRLRELGDEYDSESRCRQSVLREIDQLRRRRKSARPDAATRRAMASLSRLIEKRDRMERDETARRMAVELEAKRRDRRDAKLAELGEGWNAERLERVDTSTAAQQEFLQAARTYQNAIVRRGRFRRHFQNATRAHGKLRARLSGAHERLEGRSVDDAIAAESKRLNNLGRHGELDFRESDLKHRRNALRRLMEETKELSPVPTWFKRVLWGFAAAGGVVASIGLITAAISSVLTGATLCLSGLAGLGVALGLKRHTETAFSDDVANREKELADVETELAETRKQLGGATGGEAVSAANAIAERLTELKQLRRDGIRLEKLNKRCIRLRNRKSTVLQEFGAARQLWTETLGAIGLPETLKIPEAFENCQQVQEADAALIDWQQADEKKCRLEDRCSARRGKIDALASRLQLALPAGGDAADRLDACAARLRELRETHADVGELKEEYRKRRREADAYRARLREIQRERRAILRAGGANDVEDFEQRAELAVRRREVAELLELAQEDLRASAQTEPQLAVVEEDLLQFDAEENENCIEALEAELTDLQSDLHRAHEQLGGINGALQRLENDRDATRRRLHRQREETQLRETAREWLAEELTWRTLNALRSRFGRGRQPTVLNSASRFLRQLTGDRYRRLWAPLGRKSICADDHLDRTWELNTLSGGTREQIFLALRLALVEEYAERNRPLPLVLDDVLVNFDRHRTEAAVETLIDLGTRGQQIVFLTCHQHIEELFARHGITAVPLPTHHGETQHRIAG